MPGMIVIESDRERVSERANDLANRMLPAPTNLAEAMYKREWHENAAPTLSVLLPGTRAGGTTACRFDHPDQNGPLGINPAEWAQQLDDGDQLDRTDESGELARGMEMPSLGKGECH